MLLTAKGLRWLSTLYRTWWLTFWHPEVSSASDPGRLATTCGKRVLSHPNSFAVNPITPPRYQSEDPFPRCSVLLSLIDSHHSTLLFTYPVGKFTSFGLELQKKTPRNSRSAQVQDLGQKFAVAAENELQCQGGGGGGGSSIRKQLIDQHAINKSVDGVGDSSEAILQEKSVCKIGKGRWTRWVGGRRGSRLSTGCVAMRTVCWGPPAPYSQMQTISLESPPPLISASPFHATITYQVYRRYHRFPLRDFDLSGQMHSFV